MKVYKGRQLLLEQKNSVRRRHICTSRKYLMFKRRLLKIYDVRERLYERSCIFMQLFFHQGANNCVTNFRYFEKKNESIWNLALFCHSSIQQ